MGTVNSLSARMLAVVRAPRSLFERLAATPVWADVLAVAFLVTALSSAVLLETERGRLALLDQWERTALAFGQAVDDSEYAALEQASDNGAAYAIASAIASGPLLTVALAAALFLLFRRAADGTTFRQVLSVVAHAGVILMLRQIITAPVVYARETLASPTTLSVFFTMLDEASPLARFFGIVDVFVIWWIAVLAIGMSVLFRQPARRLALAFMGTYVLLAGVLTIAMALTGGAV